MKVPDITKLPLLVQYLIASANSTAALLLTQSLISNRTEKLVTGLAAIAIPVTYLLIVAFWRLAHARETAARINQGLPTR